MHLCGLDQVLPKGDAKAERLIAYKITCLINGKGYIGITKRRLIDRWADHKEAARDGRRPRIYAAMRKYGIENFVIEPLATAFSVDGLFETERVLIVAHNTLIPHGYNMSIGGDGPKGLTHSPESRARMSAAHRGKKQSAETIAKRIPHLRGRKFPPRPKEWCAKISRANRGRKRSPEHRQKMEGRFKGRVFTPEWRAKISAAKKGKPLSEATRAAQKKKVTGMKRPPRTKEHTAKLVEGLKAYHRRRKQASEQLDFGI